MRVARNQIHPHVRLVVFVVAVFPLKNTSVVDDCVCFFSRNSTSRRHLRPLKRLPGAKQRRQRRHAGLSVPRLQVRQNLPLRRISLARLVCDRGLTIVVAVFSFHRYCSLKCAHTHTQRRHTRSTCGPSTNTSAGRTR